MLNLCGQICMAQHNIMLNIMFNIVSVFLGDGRLMAYAPKSTNVYIHSMMPRQKLTLQVPTDVSLTF